MTTLDLAQLLLIKIFSFMAIGYLLGRFGFVTLQQIRFALKWVVVYLLFPILIFQNTVTHLDLQNLYQTGFIFTAALFMVFGSFSLVSLLYDLVKFKVERRAFILAGTFHNYGFAVYPIVVGVLGESALPMAFVFIITCDALFWALGSFILSRDSKEIQKIPLDQILSPPLVSLLLSVLIVALSINQYIPSGLLLVLKYPGSGAIPGALTCIGGIIYFTLNDTIIKEKPKKSAYAGLLFFRNLFLPILWLAILYVLPLENNIKAIIGIEAVMPSSIGIIFLTGMYGADTRFTAIYSTLSNVISIITVPIFLAILLKMLS